MKVKDYILQWTQNPANKIKKEIAVAVIILVAILIFFYGLGKLSNWLHDVNYENQQNADKTNANKAEVNANTHETNANVAANNQKELEKNEQNIKNQQADQQKILATDKQKSKNTRDRLNNALHQNVPSRNGNDGLSDDQLRSDSNRAAAAINANRN